MVAELYDMALAFAGLGGLIVAAAATVRFVVNPVLKARRVGAEPDPAATAGAARVDARLAALEEDVRQLGDALERVAATAEFDAQLRAGRGSGAQLGPGPTASPGAEAP